MIVWVALVLGIGILLAVGIERLIARLGIRQVEPSASSLALLAERLEHWSRDRLRRD